MLMPDPFESNSFVIQIPKDYDYMTKEPIRSFFVGMPLLTNVRFGTHDNAVFREKPVWTEAKPIDFITFQFAKQDPNLSR